MTVHGTNFVRVENNVTYNTVGHCFFLEDAIEHGNEFVHNLAIQTKEVLLPSDNTVASYWITNPDNTYRDNVAAGSDSNGAFEGTDAAKTTWPRRTPIREFKGDGSLWIKVVSTAGGGRGGGGSLQVSR
jgi:hypothetical protein